MRLGVKICNETKQNKKNPELDWTKLLLWCRISLHCFLPAALKCSLSVVHRRKRRHVTETVKDKGFCFDLWTLYLFCGHTSSSARPPRGFRTSNTTGQLLRRRQGQWYLQVPIQAQEIPLGPHWQIVLVWPHERVGIAVIAYFPLIAFVTCGVCCTGAYRCKLWLGETIWPLFLWLHF